MTRPVVTLDVIEGVEAPPVPMPLTVPTEGGHAWLDVGTITSAAVTDEGRTRLTVEFDSAAVEFVGTSSYGWMEMVTVLGILVIFAAAVVTVVALVVGAFR